ncbi:MAG: alpha/beta hydrolase, partial [Bacteroidales bacterium]|nr:alpha/beta hydrolase [Bacteroidales bacterium]
VQNSIQFYNAMLEKGVDGSLHIFPYGRHSISLKNESAMLNYWTSLCENWLYEMGLLKQK